MQTTASPPVSGRVAAALGVDTEAIEAGPLALWPHEGRAELDGHPVPLTPREFDLLLALVSAAGHLVPRARLHELVWGQPFTAGQRDVDAYVRKLRGKLSPAAPDWVFTHTHYWIGYRLWPERQETP
jgi:DNA-binding response OmpR family regulator